MEVLEAGVSDVGFQTQHFLRRSWELWDPSRLCVTSPRLVSQPLFLASMWIFLSFFQRVRVTSLDSGFLSEWIVLYVAVDLVYEWKEVSSGASYVTTCTETSEMPKLISSDLFIHHTSANSCPHSKKGGSSDHCSRRVESNNLLSYVQGSKRGGWPQAWILKLDKIFKVF